MQTQGNPILSTESGVSPVRFRAQPPLRKRESVTKVAQRTGNQGDNPYLKAAGVSAKLIENRDNLRAIYGTRWTVQRPACEAMIRASMAFGRQSMMAAATQLARAAVDDGMGLLAAKLLAVATEIIMEESGVTA